MTTNQTQRDLNSEAFLWYSLTSPEFLDSAYEKLANLSDFLRQQFALHPVANDFGPALYWGDVVDTLLDTYPNARALLVNGEFSAMREWCIKAGDIGRGFREQGMWMDLRDFRTLLDKIDQVSSVSGAFMDAIVMAWYFNSDGGNDWRQYDRDDGFRGASIMDYIDYFPGLLEIPDYEVDSKTCVATGSIVPWTGVWVPSDGMKSAALAFAIQGRIMQPMYPITNVDDNGYEYTEPVETVWHPVIPTGRTISVQQEVHSQRHIPSGEVCPESGYWFTPAKQGSRCYFKQGDMFPKIEGSAYGDTFWQRSPDQAGPRLHQ